MCRTESRIPIGWRMRNRRMSDRESIPITRPSLSTTTNRCTWEKHQNQDIYLKFSTITERIYNSNLSTTVLKNSVSCRWNKWHLQKIPMQNSNSKFQFKIPSRNSTAKFHLEIPIQTSNSGYRPRPARWRRRFARAFASSCTCDTPRSPAWIQSYCIYMDVAAVKHSHTHTGVL